MSPRHQQLVAGGPGRPTPCLRLGDAGWVSPLPGQVLYSRAEQVWETLAQWCLEPGSWLSPRGSRVRGWKALAGLWRGGQWWGASAGKCDQLPSPLCRALGCVSCWLPCLCVGPSPGTFGKVKQLPCGWTLPCHRGEAGVPQGRAVQGAWSLPRTGAALGMVSPTSHSQAALTLLIQYLSCPPAPGKLVPPCLPEAEQQRNP